MIGNAIFWAGCGLVVLILFGIFLGSLFWNGLYWLGIGTIGAGLAMFACQCFLFVLDGFWTNWNLHETLIATGFGDLPDNLGGMMGIIRWAAVLPLAVEVAVIGLLITLVGIKGQAFVKCREGSRRKLY